MPRVAVIVAVVAGVAGCSNAPSSTCQCPQPVAYDDATLTKISQALRALPSETSFIKRWRIMRTNETTFGSAAECSARRRFVT